MNEKLIYIGIAAVVGVAIYQNYKLNSNQNDELCFYPSADGSLGGRYGPCNAK